MGKMISPPSSYYPFRLSAPRSVFCEFRSCGDSLLVLFQFSCEFLLRGVHAVSMIRLFFCEFLLIRLDVVLLPRSSSCEFLQNVFFLSLPRFFFADFLSFNRICVTTLQNLAHSLAVFF